MKRICLIIPYFGKFPNYFQLWLNSVKYNPQIDFLIITDDETQYEYPTNVILKRDSFQNIRARIKEKYDFRVPLKSPYKLCDFKVAYGDIFEQELKGYDFWGYCDVDLIFGDIKKFVTDEILNIYDKINIHGHFSLYRNNEDMRYLYKKIYKDLINYKIAFSTNWIYHFDEYPGMAYIAKRENIKMIDIEEYADIDRFLFKFRKVYDHSEKNNDNNKVEQIFRWGKGKLTNIIKNDKQMIKNEILYIHLQKRIMNNNVKNKEDYFIVPNEFINCSEEKINELINCYSKNQKYDEFKKFKKQCLKQKFTPSYWKMKIKTRKIMGD